MSAGKTIAITVGVVGLVAVVGIGGYMLLAPRETNVTSSASNLSQQQQPPAGDNTGAVLQLIGTAIQSGTQITTAVLASQRQPAEGTSVQNQR